MRKSYNVCVIFVHLFTGFFKQFGTVKRLRIARNKKVGCHYIYLILDRRSFWVLTVNLNCVKYRVFGSSDG